mmetsp:Transcript_6427/g.15588  ORF Transcript_6427/g.15588 Transcript_6427/m.15588 type:complete len:704 (+) Transcript_6427:137-2248(+)
MKAARAYDHVYDPNYITSCVKDHARLTTKATFGPTRIERVPDDKYMFSELPHYPRQTLQVKTKEELPMHMGRGWYPPEMKGSTGPETTMVYGKYRHKFFMRPNKQMLSNIPHIVQYALKEDTVRRAPGGDQTVAAATMPEPKAKTVGTQSLYRESEAQTNPYSPEYVTSSDQSPEVLTITHLVYGGGLPATEAELKMIERTRQKRIFEAMLPPPTDQFNLEVRSQLMEQQEFRDWAEREKHIKDLQDKRLELLKDALEGRKDKYEQGHGDKVDRVRQKKEDDRDRVLAACQRQRIKVLRKMQKERQQAEEKKTKRDVIADHADFTSEVYAPLMRNGHIPDSNTAKIEVLPADLTSYEGLVQLEQSLPSTLFKAPDRRPQDFTKRQKTSYQLRKEAEMAAALKAAMDSIKRDLQQSTDGEATDKTGAMGTLNAAAMKKRDIRNLLDRPETPRVEGDVLPEEEEKEAAVLLLQRIIRGRAYQNQMFEGKEKRLDLINELRAAERYAETATTTEERRYWEQFQEKAFEGVLESMQGSVISQTLDQLSKELLRFQEERRIAAMVKLAERDRQLRQAQESGRRQAEERLREREDEMFRQIMGVHQGTVDSYLEEVLTNTVEQAAQSRALMEARLKAAKINQVVDAIEASEQEPEVVVRELVHSFNLPHVQRETIKRRIQVENKRFSEAARSALDETYRKTEENLSDQR